MKNFLVKIRMLFWLLLLHPISAIKACFGKYPSEIDFDYVAKFIDASNPVIVEAGAFNGDDTYRFLQYFPACRIFALEPIPSLFEKLLVRFSGEKNLVLIPSALVGSCEKNVRIWTNQSGNPHSASSILQPGSVRDVYPGLDFDKSIEVDALDLDSLVASQKIKKIDLLWLDLQGAELDVMSGSEDALRIVNLIHVEVNRKALYKSGATFREVNKFLDTAGFMLLKLNMTFLSGNALYLRKSIRG